MAWRNTCLSRRLRRGRATAPAAENGIHTKKIFTILVLAAGFLSAAVGVVHLLAGSPGMAGCSSDDCGAARSPKSYHIKGDQMNSRPNWTSSTIPGMSADPPPQFRDFLTDKPTKSTSATRRTGKGWIVPLLGLSLYMVCSFMKAKLNADIARLNQQEEDQQVARYQQEFAKQKACDDLAYQNAAKRYLRDSQDNLPPNELNFLNQIQEQMRSTGGSPHRLASQLGGAIDGNGALQNSSSTVSD
jgi:hypothetical protein